MALEPSLSGPVNEIAAARRDRLLQSLNGRTADGDGDVDLILTVADAPAGQANDGPYVQIDYVGVVSRRLLVRDIPYQQLLALWHGDIQHWSALGPPVPYPVTRVTLGGSAGPVAAVMATDDADNLDDLASRIGAIH